VAEFWINEARPACSTFNRELAEAKGEPHHRILVQCRTLDDVISEWGVPHYLKIDIEDNDIVCCNQLSLATKPKFISVEMTDVELGNQLLARLCELGYDRFKIIDQRHLLSIGEQKKGLRGKFFWSLYRVANYRKENRSLPLRAMRAIAAKFLKMAAGSGLWGRAAFRSQKMPDWKFASGSSSGTFGDDLPGKWQTEDELTRSWSAELAVCRENRQMPWHDLHATTSTAN